MVNSTHCSKNGEADVKGFSIGFVEIAKQKFINSVIWSGCDASNVYGFFYQNDIESQHFVEQVEQKRKLEPSRGQDLIGILCNSVFLLSSGMQS